MAEAKKGPDKYGRWTKYKIEGTKAVNANQSCPKCGSGHLMAAHKNRNTCGGCGYTEFTKKAEAK